MHEIAEAIREGLSLFYGPPGSGKTSVTLKLVERAANKILWISTTESPKFLKKATTRIGADPTKFNFLDFPRAFREDIIKYILDHANEYDALVIDSINGISYSIPNLEKLAHSVLYQISQTKPVILIAEEEHTKLHYIADHVIHIWYRKNSLGHIIRYAQLEKSRTHPPSPRYIFEILEDGIFFIDIREKVIESEAVYDSHFNCEVIKGSSLCILTENAEGLRDLLQQIRDKSLFVGIGPWNAFKGIRLSEVQFFALRGFQDLFKLSTKLNGKIYLVISGLLNLQDYEIADYIVAISAFSSQVQNIILAEVGSFEETKRITKYCMKIIYIYS